MNQLTFNSNFFDCREQLYAVGPVNILQQAAVCSTVLAASEKRYPVLKWEILLRKCSAYTCVNGSFMAFVLQMTLDSF